MISLRQTQITVQDRDCFTVDEYATQFSTDGHEGPASTPQTEESVNQALEDGHLTADQALWLHEHQRSWQISVE